MRAHARPRTGFPDARARRWTWRRVPDETHVVAQGKELVADRVDQRRVVAARKVGAADRALEQHVADEGQLCFRLVEHHVAGRVAGTVQHGETQRTDFDRVAVFQPPVGHEGLDGRKTEHGRLLRQLMEGGGVIGEVTLDAIRTNGTSRDHPHEQRDAGGGNRAAWKYVLRFSCKLPAAQRDKADEGILLVRTTEDSLLVWQLAGQEERPPLHAEHVRRQLVRFGREQARLRDDLKLEKRWPSRVRQKMVSRQNDLAAKRSRMLRTFCQQAAAMTVAFARRRKCGTIQYDDTVRTFAASFPWHQLRDAIAAKCQAEGVILVDANPKPAENGG